MSSTPTRNIAPTPVLEDYIRAQVATGHYSNASKVVRAGLRLLILQRHLPDLPVLLAPGHSRVLAQDGLDGFELQHKPYSADQLGRLLSRIVPPSPARQA